MRYGSKSMAQVDWSYYLSKEDELRKFYELFVAFSCGIRVNPWVKSLESNLIPKLIGFLEFHGLSVISR